MRGRFYLLATMVPNSVFPFRRELRLPGLFISKTIIGILFALHRAKAVWSIIRRFFIRASSKVTVLYFFAFLSFSGSAVYTPSTLVPFSKALASISQALRAEAESVVK